MPGDSWHVFAASALLAGLVFVLVVAYGSDIPKVPGPWLTKFTSIRLVWEEFHGSRRTYVHELHKNHGSVARLGPNEVSFTSSSALKEIYTSGGSGYDKTEFYNLFMQFSKRTMFSTLGRKDHSQRKRQMAASYANSNILQPHVLEGLHERAEAFAKKCTELKGASVDVYVYLHCFALDCTSHHIFNPYGTRSIEKQNDRAIMEELSYHDSLIQNLLQHRLPYLSALLNIIVPPRPSPLSNTYVHKASAEHSPSAHTLLHALKSSKPSLPHLTIAAECMDHLAAGIDTTGDALCFLMYALSLPENHSIQDRLSSELIQSNNKSLDDLPYLDAVIKESLRLWSPIPMSQPRYVPKGGRFIDGYFLQAGTVVSAQAWSVHRLNEGVWADGEDFLPERWLGGKGGKDSDLVEMNKCFFAFGAGARGCTGRHLAMAEMKILLQSIYSQFSTSIAPDMNGDMEIADQIISSRPRGQACKLVFERLKTTSSGT